MGNTFLGKTTDLAGRAFWEAVWQRRGHCRLWHLSYSQHCFGRLLSQYAMPQYTACEIGCGNSVWVPFLARQGVIVWGIDYSETGIEFVRRNLMQEGVTANLVKADALEGEPLPKEFFDLIFSLGFMEHFDDGGAVVARLAEFVRPDGIMVTLVPNLAGVRGSVQKRVDPTVNSVHVAYNPEELDCMHAKGGLVAIEPARYFGGFGPLVVNYTHLLRRLPKAIAWVVVGGLWLLQQATCWGAAAVLRGSESQRFSAHIVSVYQRPAVRPEPIDNSSNPNQRNSS